MSKKVFGTVLKVVGIAALTVFTFGVGSGLLVTTKIGLTALSTALLIGGSLALSIGSGLLAAAKAAKINASARAEQIRAMVNPQAMANWVFGETATAIQIIYSETAGSKKDKATLVYAGPAHEIDSYGQLYINDEAVNFSGNDATGAWAGAVKRYLNLGAESQLALVIPNSTWPSTARGRGFAHFALQWSLDHDKVKDGGVIPDRITQVVQSSLCYDPRLDTTVGGSGLHRANDQTTWEYSANWALIVLHYILGWRNNSILVYGRGADPLDIDYASFISAANVCDATVDGIPRYHIGGIERIDGNHARVIASLEATIGGKIAKIGGKYFCWAPFDDLVSLETISETDLIRNVGVNFQADRSLENIFSVGQGQFIDPSVLYVPAPYPEVSDTDAVTAMGRRIMRYDTPFLQDVKRVERVVLQQIRRSLFGRIWQIGVGPKFFRRNVFDILTLNIEETNNTDTLVRITNKVISPNGLIILTLEEENALIYDVTAPLGTPFSRSIPPTFDHATKIPVVNLVLSAVTVTGSAGTASDAIQVSYDDPGPLVNRTDIEIRVNSTTNWHPAASKILDAGIAIILPVESGTLYDVRVRHWTLFDVPSVFVSDTVTAGQSQVAALIAGQGNLATLDTVDWNNDLDNIPTDTSQLLPDPGLFLGTVGWVTPNANHTIEDDTITDGFKKRLNMVGDGVQHESRIVTVDVAPGDKLFVKYSMAKASVPSGSFAGMRIRFEKADGTPSSGTLIIQDAVSLSGTAWIEFASEVVVPADMVKAHLIAINQANHTTGSLFITDMRVGRHAFGADITADNTAALIAGQGDLATLDTVDTAQIDALAITNAKLAALAVDAAKLASNAVTEIKIFDSAVTTNKINNLAVDAAKLANSAVTATKIDNLAVGTAAIAALAVTEAKIGALAVTSAKIQNLAVGTAAIAALAVETVKIKDNAVTETADASNTSEITLGSTFVELESVTIVVPSGESWRVAVQAQWTWGRTGTITHAVNILPYKLLHDTTIIQSNTLSVQPDNDYTAVLPMLAFVTLGAGNHTLSIEARVSFEVATHKSTSAAILVQGLKK